MEQSRVEEQGYLVDPVQQLRSCKPGLFRVEGQSYVVSLVKELRFYKPGWTVDPANGCGRAKSGQFPGYKFMWRGQKGYVRECVLLMMMMMMMMMIYSRSSWSYGLTGCTKKERKKKLLSCGPTN